MVRLAVISLALAVACSGSGAKKPPADVTDDSGVAGGGGSAGGGSGGSRPPTAGSGGGGAAGGPAGQDASRSSGDDARVQSEGGVSADAGQDRSLSDVFLATSVAAGNSCPANVSGDPLPQSRAAMMIKGGFSFLEGPVWVAAPKALYFSDFQGTGTGGRIHKYTPADNKFEVFVMNVGTNGLAVDAGGMIVAASHDMQRLTRFDPANGMRTPIAGSDMYMNRPFNSVNDVVVRGDGNIYFTDPTYQRGQRQGQDMTAYYRLSPAGVITRLATMAQPNGINLSPDGRYLYVASSGGDPLRRFTLAADGSASDPMTLAMSGSDGMAVDCAGNLYLTTAGMVRVFSPMGQPIGNITGFAGGTTNAAFGGEDGKTLFVTAGGALYQIRLNLPGLPN